jgi:phosphate uptake regulator
MFNWLKRIQESADGSKEILSLFEEMLDDGRHIFDAASACLLSGADPEAVKEDIWKTDIRINKNERRIRRRVLTHAALNGRAAVAGDLIWISLVKDAERIGDYGKNIYDIAAIGRPLNPQCRANLLKLRERASRMLVRAKNIYRSEDEDAARDFITEASEFCQLCDRRTEEIIRSTEGDGALAASALAYRYLKRVVSHLMNIVTAVVMPFDKLDFFDEE